MSERDMTTEERGIFWGGVSFGLRWLLAVTHLLFGVPFIIRPGLALILPSFYAFDDPFPAVNWGWWSVVCALLLIFLPTRVPLGLISTAFSAYFYFAVGATFGLSAGFIPGTAVYGIGCGGAAMLLFARALWLYMSRVRWFRRLRAWRCRRDVSNGR